MFDKLLKQAEHANNEERLKIGVQIITRIFGIEAFAGIASYILGLFLGKITNSVEVEIISICFLIPMFTLWFFLIADKKEKESGEVCNDEKVNDENDYSVVSGYGTMPHFSSMYREYQIKHILSNHSFHPFIRPNGKKSGIIRVSEDDKWVCIFGAYYPIDLICGYNKTKNEIYAIDGTIIKLPIRCKLRSAGTGIEEFFEDRGFYYKSMPGKAEVRFEAALDRPRKDLSRADWGMVRYQWEKAIAGSSNKDGKIGDDFFERVLTDAEIARVVRAIGKGEVSLSYYTDFEKYQNEFSVCNGIRLISVIGKQAKYDEMDFLFRCLEDVDETYFLMAVEVLKKSPRTKVQEKLEEKARIAYEEYDVQELGGLLYLAKVIGYDIQYVKKIKEAQEKGDLSSNAALEFEVDEKELLGSDYVQRFSPYAYQYKKVE
ncbi:hypothetical protein [Butyrivibrio sp. INlla16]|uniref:hypothetical protein n=1 Tax=Butyrivibrio sp. INlla16 TaxID=1520807 RepID=UPI00088131B8|nr:hypothetical protein [Butyrivibrio sp. INlla16]SDB49140.1 hypothetical protein SAMN02910263_02444 [Butyrivibrio sp. INlla16]